MERETSEADVEPQQEDISPHYEGTSIRWKQFSTSFALATKKLSMGWSYDDFAQCVPGWSSAEPRKAADVCRQMSDFIHDYLIKGGEELFDHYHTAEGLDALHQVIMDAKARQAEGEIAGPDVWTKILEPKEAIRSRVFPVLQDEKERLEAVLAELTTETEQMTEELRQSNRVRSEQDKLVSFWLDQLEETARELRNMPAEQVESWSIDAQESRL